MNLRNDEFIPGPWRVQINHTSASILTATKDGSYGSAVALLQQVHKPYIIPTARLIASAPEMFAYILERAGSGDTEAVHIVEVVRGIGC